MFQHSREIFCLKILIFEWHESLQDLKKNLTFTHAANSKTMAYFCHYRSYKTDTCECGDISQNDNTYVTPFKLSNSYDAN